MFRFPNMMNEKIESINGRQIFTILLKRIDG